MQARHGADRDCAKPWSLSERGSGNLIYLYLTAIATASRWAAVASGHRAAVLSKLLAWRSVSLAARHSSDRWVSHNSPDIVAGFTVGRSASGPKRQHRPPIAAVVPKRPKAAPADMDALESDAGSGLRASWPALVRNLRTKGPPSLSKKKDDEHAAFAAGGRAGRSRTSSQIACFSAFLLAQLRRSESAWNRNNRGPGRHQPPRGPVPARAGQFALPYQ